MTHHGQQCKTFDHKGEDDGRHGKKDHKYARIDGGETFPVQGLTGAQVMSLLSICEVRIYKTDDAVCGAGTDSTEVFLPFTGELSVITGNGIPIAALTPVTTVGDIGIITGQPRTATVRAAKESEAFVINKRQFEKLVRIRSFCLPLPVM